MGSCGWRIASSVLLLASVSGGEVLAQQCTGAGRLEISNLVCRAITNVRHNDLTQVCIDIAELTDPGTAAADDCPNPQGGVAASATITLTQSSSRIEVSGSVATGALDAPSTLNFFGTSECSMSVRAVGGPVQLNIARRLASVAGGFLMFDVTHPAAVMLEEGQLETINDAWLTTATHSPQLDITHSNPSALSGVFLTIDIVPLTLARAPTTYQWINPAGGAYAVESNWDPEGITGCNDIAVFNLDTGLPISVNASGARAAQWQINGGTYNVTGPVELSGQLQSGHSLEVSNGAHFQWTANAMTNHSTAFIGKTAGPYSFMEVLNPGTSWEQNGIIIIENAMLDVNSGGSVSTLELSIGGVFGLGPAILRVADVSGGTPSSVQLSGLLTVGIGPFPTGSLAVLDGAIVRANEIKIDTSAIAAGSSNPSSPADTSEFAALIADTALTIGGDHNALLQIQKGGVAQAPAVMVDAQLGSGRIVVDGQGEFALLTALSSLGIVATEQVEVEVKNGGVLQAQEILVGHTPVRPGAADLTLRGRTNLTLNQPSRLRVVDVPSAAGPAGLTSIGVLAEGQLNIFDGASAVLEGGLIVGEFSRGIVIVSNVANPTHPDRTSLAVTGETRIGEGALGIVQILQYSKMETQGDLKIGFGQDEVQSDSVTLDQAALLNVHGKLLVGAGGVGFLKIFNASLALCDSLAVGGSTPIASGVIEIQNLGSLAVRGNAQVGGIGNSGLIEVDSSSMLTVDGTITIGGPRHGKVVVNGTLNGAGAVVVAPLGRLEGNGIVSVPKVDVGGYIAPGLSPGTLTIEGDLEMLPGGTLVIEYEGMGAGQFDVLQVSGDTKLDGRLEVHFRDGFSPADPQAFIHSQDFVEAEAEVEGDYNQRIYAFPDFFVDFDDDDDKDLQDVAAFQNCYGLSGEQLPSACHRADWEDNGLLNHVDTLELSSRLTGPI